MQNGLRKCAILLFFPALWILWTRLAQPYVLNYDTTQIYYSGIRLAQGLGYTTTAYSHDKGLGDRAPIVVLTNFPPGLGLLVAGLAQIEAKPQLLMRLFFLGVTLFGIYWWAKVLSCLIPRAWSSPTRVLSLSCFSLFMLLILPPWSGTDIILAAGTPLCLHALIRWDAMTNLKVFALGAFVGLLYAFRYAGIYLMVVAALYLFLSSSAFLRKSNAIKFLIMSGGFLFAIAPLLVFTAFNRRGMPFPAYINPKRSISVSVMSDLTRTLTAMGATGPGCLPFVWKKWVESLPISIQIMIGLVFLIGGIAGVMIIRSRMKQIPADQIESKKPFVVMFSCVFGLVAFLSTTMFFQPWDYVRMHRYYIPVYPLLPLLPLAVSRIRTGPRVVLALIFAFVLIDRYRWQIPGVKPWRSALKADLKFSESPLTEGCEPDWAMRMKSDMAAQDILFTSIPPCYLASSADLSRSIYDLPRFKGQLVKKDIRIFIEVAKQCEFVCTVHHDIGAQIVTRNIPISNSTKDMAIKVFEGRRSKVYRVDLREGMIF